jgi:hypothetical protein
VKFTKDWLALRAAADRRSRATDLMAMAAAVANKRCEDEVVEIVDLAAGTGATMRALAPMIEGRRQHWTLVDADATLLAEAERLTAAAPPAPGLTLTLSHTDLSVEPTPWAGVPDLVTASALFDIVSMRFIGRLTERLAGDRVPLLALLTYDGGMTLSPAHPADAAMERAYNTHMRGEKSFGRAVGPDAGALLAQTLEAAGFIVYTRDSAWRLTRAEDAALIDVVVENWAAAAAEVMPPEERATVAEWLRHARAAEALTVGHSDLLALP